MRRTNVYILDGLMFNSMYARIVVVWAHDITKIYYIYLTITKY